MSDVLREVYIDNVRMDVDEKSETSYIFISPVFRDVSQVLSNRTTTYKLPKTENNLKAIGLINNPEITNLYPYRKHDILEYRNGLLFIKGLCALLAVTENDLEFSVTWGNAINLLSLKDINLRELTGDQYVEWNENSSFLLSSDQASQYGFIAVDFGRGLGSFEYIHPSITIQGILDIITQSSGVEFEYPERFTNVFKKTWIPLLEKNANHITWEETDTIGKMTGQAPALENAAIFTPIIDSLGLIDSSGAFQLPIGEFLFSIENGTVELSGDWSVYQLVIQFIGGRYSNWGDPTIANDNTPKFYFNFTYDPETDKSKTVVNFEALHIVEDTLLNDKSFLFMFPTIFDPNGFDKARTLPMDGTDIQLRVKIKQDQVPFGYKFPIIPNLPDMKVTDFLKSLMQMYGLWTYYNFRDDDVIEFLSIDEIYEYKPNAYDWSNKLVNTNRGQFNLSYTYGDYARTNAFKYKNDSDIAIDANGSIVIDNNTISSKEKVLVEVDFSPSYSNTDGNNNVFARIELYDNEGELQNVNNRILSEPENTYKKDSLEYKTALFEKNMYFGGDAGLIETYYKTFQLMLRYPVIAECYVYLTDVELHLYKEAYPVYIRGTYYMPITVTVQTNGLATVKLIKMPVQE